MIAAKECDGQSTACNPAAMCFAMPVCESNTMEQPELLRVLGPAHAWKIVFGKLGFIVNTMWNLNCA